MNAVACILFNFHFKCWAGNYFHVPQNTSTSLNIPTPYEDKIKLCEEGRRERTDWQRHAQARQ